MKCLVSTVGNKWGEINEENVVSYLRSNHSYGEEIFQTLQQNNSSFYVYYLDGDNWDQRDIWLEGKFETELSLQLLELIEYKDCIMMYADEYILISQNDILEEIKDILKDKDYTMTILALKNVQMSFEDFCSYGQEETKEIKKEGVGKIDAKYNT